MKTNNDELLIDDSYRLSDIEALVKLFRENDLGRLVVQTGENRIEIEDKKPPMLPPPPHHPHVEKL